MMMNALREEPIWLTYDMVFLFVRFTAVSFYRTCYRMCDVCLRAVPGYLVDTWGDVTCQAVKV